MIKKSIKSLAVIIAAVLILGIAAPSAYCAGKLGYVDLRRAFYEYEKTKTLEQQLNEETETRGTERTKMIDKITKLRDAAELLSGKAKTDKQAEIDEELSKLQELDRDTRQSLLNKKNDMFRAVIEDIQKVVEEIGEKGGYDYILDSRNIMYAKPDFDLTNEVIKKLNK
jgi:outer membrane protein